MFLYFVDFERYRTVSSLFNPTVVLIILVSFSLRLNAQVPPALQLANVYRADVQVEDFWVSEKLDGVRAYWDGTRFLSKNGHVYQAPAWFIQNMPKFALDGELWIARNTFNELSGIVRKKTPVDAEWRKVSYQIFDLPQHSAIFDRRLQILRTLFSQTSHHENLIYPEWLVLIKQFKVDSHSALMNALDRVVSQGGEGLMLHLGRSYYHGRRDDELLKLKQYFDAEANVIEHYPGQGKYQGLLGSMLVESIGLDNKRVKFRIGTGFSDKERQNPPPVGKLITYKYFGYTQSGLPKFPSFLRIRADK